MTFEEFKKEAFSRLRELLKAHPDNEVDEYIESLAEDVEKFYNEAKELSELLGTNQVSPRGYAYGRMMMF